MRKLLRLTDSMIWDYVNDNLEIDDRLLISLQDQEKKKHDEMIKAHKAALRRKNTINKK